MKRLALLVMLLGVGAMSITGCSSTKTKAGGEASSQTTAAPAASGNAGATAATGMGGFSGDPLDDPNSPLAKRTVYFDYDSSVVRDEFSATLEAHADYLAKHPNAKVTLEGNCDERGTREYNLSLGERRAQAVQQFMLLMNVKQGQITTVSYGEERPAVVGNNEAAWSKNRRVEIVYQR